MHHGAVMDGRPASTFSVGPILKFDLDIASRNNTRCAFSVRSSVRVDSNAHARATNVLPKRDPATAASTRATVPSTPASQSPTTDRRPYPRPTIPTTAIPHLFVRLLDLALAAATHLDRAVSSITAI